jgi:hypothetical protein
MTASNVPLNYNGISRYSARPKEALKANIMQEDAQILFWTNVLRAAEAEPKAARSIRGASGIQHPIVALGFDEDRRRLLMVSGEHDVRTAAMAQVDVQAALENTQVLVARPIALNFTSLAKMVVSMLGKETITSDDITGLASKPGDFSDAIKEALGPSLAPLDFISSIPLNVLAQWMNSIQQLTYCNFTFEDTEDPAKKAFKNRSSQARRPGPSRA